MNRRLSQTKRFDILGVGIFVDLNAIHVVILEDYIVLVNSTNEIPETTEGKKIHSIEKLPVSSKKLLDYLNTIEDSNPNADIYLYINYEPFSKEIPYCKFNEELFLDSETNKLKKEIIKLKNDINDGEIEINDELMTILEKFDMSQPHPTVLALLLALEAINDINYMLYIFG